MKTNPPAIEAFNLTKIYGHGNTEVVAMNHVSLRVERGEVVALLGPSGAGKSTLLTALGLINPPTSGRIEFSGTLVLEADRPQVDLRSFRRKHLGFVFQKANLIPFLTAVENIQIAMEINDTPPRTARRRALELLDYLGVAPRAGNRPDALSGGQQQRVAVARALVTQPAIIWGDEPTGNLDSVAADDIMGLLGALHAEGGQTVVIVTHSRAVAERADRIVHMRDGRVTEEEILTPTRSALAPALPPTPESPRPGGLVGSARG